MMGELKFFLGLQVKQIDEGIYIHQTKYVKELLKKFKMDNAKCEVLWMERKSTSGGCYFISGCLVSWTRKKKEQ